MAINLKTQIFQFTGQKGHDKTTEKQQNQPYVPNFTGDIYSESKWVRGKVEIPVRSNVKVLFDSTKLLNGRTHIINAGNAPTSIVIGSHERKWYSEASPDLSTTSVKSPNFKEGKPFRFYSIFTTSRKKNELPDTWSEDRCTKFQVRWF